MIPSVDLSDIVIKNSETINPRLGWHWHGRITTQDIYITSMVKIVGLITTIAMTAIGGFLVGIPTAGLTFAACIITSLFLCVLAEKVERASWLNQLNNNYKTGEKRYHAPSLNTNVVIDNEKNISLRLTPQDLAKEQNILFRENQLNENVCLVKIIKTEDQGGISLGGTISLHICESKYENRKFNVKVDDRVIPVFYERIFKDRVV